MFGNPQVRAIAFTTALASAGSLSSAVLAPSLAHADPLDAIRSAVNNARSGSPCPALTYNYEMEAEAQLYARDQGTTTPVDYIGKWDTFRATGDPQSEAINRVMGTVGPKLSDCEYQDYGVGFVRYDDEEIDVVAIALGKPGLDGPDDPVEADPAEAEVDEPEPAPVEPAPHDAILMTVEVSGFDAVVSVSNTSDVDGTCTYDASPVGPSLLPDVHHDFTVDGKTKKTLTFVAPPPLSTYHVEVSCTGEFNGETIELGHAEQNVTG